MLLLRRYVARCHYDAGSLQDLRLRVRICRFPAQEFEGLAEGAFAHAGEPP